MSRFPLSAFPKSVQEVIFDIQECTQAPIPLIASSVIGAMSLACQPYTNVRINDSLITPVSLFLLVIANSGERKTTVDRMVLKPFYQRDKDALIQSEKESENYALEKEIWCEKRKAISGQIRRKTAKGLSIEDEVQRLRNLELEKPMPPKISKYVYNNTTPEALQFAMYSHSPHVGLIADEGANILDRKVMTDFTFINSMWDGVDFHVERKTTKSFTIRDGRITLSVMVQKKPFDSFLKRLGEKARGSGFFARCLPVFIDENLTTQGERFIRPQPNNQTSLNSFHQRIAQLLVDDASDYDVNKSTCLSFEPSALHEWEDIYNLIEMRISPDEKYANMNDFASKLANNVARLSAVFCYFTEGPVLIKKEHVDGAWLLCEWYMEQAIELFGYEEGYYEALLLSWLRREFYRSGKESIRYNEIRRCGPNVLRKGKLLDKVIKNLEKSEVIEVDHSYFRARIVYQDRNFHNNRFTEHTAYTVY